MTLRSSDLQSDSDLDSIRNSCDVLTAQWEWELQRGPQISPPPQTFFDYWWGGGALLTFLLTDQHFREGGCQLKKITL